VRRLGAIFGLSLLLIGFIGYAFAGEVHESPAPSTEDAEMQDLLRRYEVLEERSRENERVLKEVVEGAKRRDELRRELAKGQSDRAQAEPGRENAGEQSYLASVRLLNDLTILAALEQVRVACGGLGPWEVELESALRTTLGPRKRLLRRQVSFVAASRTWTGPASFSYVADVPGLVENVTLIPPPPLQHPWSPTEDLSVEGGVVVIDASGSVRDLLIGKPHVWMAFRLLECGPEERRLKTLGNEAVRLEPPRDWGGFVGLGFPDTWLSQDAVKVIVLPRGAFSRPRFDRETHVAETVHYKPGTYLIAKIVSNRQVIEIDYDEAGVMKQWLVRGSR
jgi:hypothetical protein